MNRPLEVGVGADGPDPGRSDTEDTFRHVGCWDFRASSSEPVFAWRLHLMDSLTARRPFFGIERPRSGASNGRVRRELQRIMVARGISRRLQCDIGATESFDPTSDPSVECSMPSTRTGLTSLRIGQLHALKRDANGIALLGGGPGARGVSPRRDRRTSSGPRRSPIRKEET
jgi:hypothetical protein